MKSAKALFFYAQGRFNFLVGFFLLFSYFRSRRDKQKTVDASSFAAVRIEVSALHFTLPLRREESSEFF